MRAFVDDCDASFCQSPFATVCPCFGVDEFPSVGMSDRVRYSVAAMGFLIVRQCACGRRALLSVYSLASQHGNLGCSVYPLTEYMRETDPNVGMEAAFVVR